MPIRPENRDRYPADWPQIRDRILRRATRWIPGSEDYAPRCECRGECGRGTHADQCPNFHGGLAYGTGSTVVLTVAHLDHQPENNHSANLRAMCQGCHLHYDREHHAETRAITFRQSLVDAGQLELTMNACQVPDQARGPRTDQAPNVPPVPAEKTTDYQGKHERSGDGGN